MEAFYLMPANMMQNQNLSKKLLNSSIYTVCARGIDKFSALLTVVLLARLLEPSEFGVMAIALICITVIEALSRVSVEETLIQKKDPSKQDFDVAWTYGRVIRSLVITIIIFLSAPYIANFFEEPRLDLMLKTLTLVQIFNGFENIGMIKYTKDMDLRYPFYSSLSNKISRLTVTIILALIFQNAWAFVFGYIAASFSTLALSYYFSSFRPSLNFNFRILKNLFNFSQWIMLTYIVNAFYSSIDRAFVGKLLSITTLGYYQLAVRFGGELPGEVKSISNLVLFPFYSFKKERIEDVKKNYLFLIKFITFFSASLICFLYFASENLVVLFLGNKWIEVISPLKILLISSFLQIIISQSYPLFKGLEIPRYEFFITGITITAILLSIYPLVLLYGLDGAALAVLLGNTIALPAMIYFLSKNTKIKLSQILETLPSSIISGLLGGLSIYYLQLQSQFAISWYLLFASILCSFLTTAFVYYVFSRVFNDPDFKSLNIIFKGRIYDEYFKKK